MAVPVEIPPRSTIPKPKARLLKGLARRASAPTRSHLSIGISKPGEGRRVGEQCSIPFPHSPTVSPRLGSNLLSEFAVIRAATSRLRFERDEWRNTAQTQERQLLASQRYLRAREAAIADLEHENAALHAANEEDVVANNSIFDRYRDAITKHDKLVDELNEKERALARLKKSDRAKGKVWQRNLRLKATLQRFTSGAISPIAQTKANTESSLQEALALAAERIEELENTGSKLLEALEERNDSCGSEEDEEDGEARLLEADVVFRGVIKDETFQEQKDLWKDLLGE